MALQAARAAAAGAAAAVSLAGGRRLHRAAALSGCICSSMAAHRSFSQSPAPRRSAPPRRTTAPAAGRTAERSSRRQQLFVQVRPDGLSAWQLHRLLEVFVAHLCCLRGSTIGRRQARLHMTSAFCIPLPAPCLVGSGGARRVGCMAAGSNCGCSEGRGGGHHTHRWVLARFRGVGAGWKAPHDGRHSTMARNPLRGSCSPAHSCCSSPCLTALLPPPLSPPPAPPRLQSRVCVRSGQPCSCGEAAGDQAGQGQHKDVHTLPLHAGKRAAPRARAPRARLLLLCCAAHSHLGGIPALPLARSRRSCCCCRCRCCCCRAVPLASLPVVLMVLLLPPLRPASSRRTWTCTRSAGRPAAPLGSQTCSSL